MGFGGIGLILICTSIYGLCRVYRISATLPVVAVAFFLVQVGAIHGA